MEDIRVAKFDQKRGHQQANQHFSTIQHPEAPVSLQHLLIARSFFHQEHNYHSKLNHTNQNQQHAVQVHLDPPGLNRH